MTWFTNLRSYYQKYLMRWRWSGRMQSTLQKEKIRTILCVAYYNNCFSLKTGYIKLEFLLLLELNVSVGGKQHFQSVRTQLKILCPSNNRYSEQHNSLASSIHLGSVNMIPTSIDIPNNVAVKKLSTRSFVTSLSFIRV